jgi:hypothetical protein
VAQVPILLGTERLVRRRGKEEEGVNERKAGMKIDTKEDEPFPAWKGIQGRRCDQSALLSYFKLLRLAIDVWGRL